jgi:putative oxidoreductase
MAKDLGYDIKQIQIFFMIMGLPQELAAFMALLEVFGGALLIIGVLTRILTFLFTIIEMIGAFIILNISHFMHIPKGFEFALLSIPLILLTISISLLLTGPGRISIE